MYSTSSLPKNFFPVELADAGSTPKRSSCWMSAPPDLLSSPIFSLNDLSKKRVELRTSSIVRASSPGRSLELEDKVEGSPRNQSRLSFGSLRRPATEVWVRPAGLLLFLGSFLLSPAEDELQQRLADTHRIAHRDHPDRDPILVDHGKVPHASLYHPVNGGHDALVRAGLQRRLRHYARDGYVPSHQRLCDREEYVPLGKYSVHAPGLVDHNDAADVPVPHGPCRLVYRHILSDDRRRNLHDVPHLGAKAVCGLRLRLRQGIARSAAC